MRIRPPRVRLEEPRPDPGETAKPLLTRSDPDAWMPDPNNDWDEKVQASMVPLIKGLIFTCGGIDHVVVSVSAYDATVRPLRSETVEEEDDINTKGIVVKTTTRRSTSSFIVGRWVCRGYIQYHRKRGVLISWTDRWLTEEDEDDG